jgi:hypothetical protein
LRFRLLPHLCRHFYDLRANLCMMRAGAQSNRHRVPKGSDSNEGTSVGLAMAVYGLFADRCAALALGSGRGDKQNPRIAIAD